VSNFSRLKRR